MNFLFYDCEVFKHDWMMVAVIPSEQRRIVIHNDKDELLAFYKKHINDVWIGYNSKHYDQYIVQGILAGYSPFLISQWIVSGGEIGWKYRRDFANWKYIDYDTMFQMRSLKQLEAFMGNDIEETEVDFNIDRPLTEAEIESTVKYCTHDVEQTAEIFARTKDVFQTRVNLVREFDLPADRIGYPQGKLISEILGAKRLFEYDDEFRGITPPDMLILNNPEYRKVLDWLELAKDEASYESTFQMDVAGVPHYYGWGGLHGAIKNYAKEGHFIMADVASLYPSLMLRYNYFSRNVRNPDKYREIYETNLRMKAEGNPMRPVYKLICNSTYGLFKDKNSALYDPLMANNICIAGQLLLTDLIEKLESAGIAGFELVQSNTDGILIAYDGSDKAFDLIDDTVYEWEQRTGLFMEFSFFSKIYQGDVNNYIAVPEGGAYDEKGKPRWKAKGSFVKKLSELDCDLSIVNEAITKYLVEDKPIADTVNSCNDLWRFMKVVKLTKNYPFATHGGKRVNGKTFRVFASKDLTDGTLCKIKNGTKVEKFANTPDCCFIENGDIKNMPIPDKLDRQWYIDTALSRVKKFGLTN